MKIIAIILFLLGYLIISFEHFIKINKTAVSLILGILLWVVIIILQQNHSELFLRDIGGGIFALIIYLLTAMTLVEIISHYGFFDFIYWKIKEHNFSDKHLFYLIVSLAFIFSAFIDNLTTTIVSITIARHFFVKQQLAKVAAAIVLAANAGGIFSPIGDVTTTMLWFAGKFSAATIITQAFFPSVVAFLLGTLIIGKGVISEYQGNKKSLRAISRRE